MHRLVLEDGEHRFGAIEQWMARALEICPAKCVEHAPVGFRREGQHFVTGRPARLTSCPSRLSCLSRLSCPSGLVRVDAACKQRLEARVDTGPAQPFLHQRIEAEGRQVSFIEHDRVAQRDRPLVIGPVPDNTARPARAARRDEIEERPGALAVAPVPGNHRLAIHHLQIVIRFEAHCRLR